MTTKADFTTEEWDLLRAGPPEAGMIVGTAERGGTFRESFSMSKAYAEARRRHGGSELVDALVSSNPKVDRTRHGSYDELKEHGMQLLRDAVALLESKATTEEVEGYRSFVLVLARGVAAAHEEDDVRVTDAEEAAIAAVGEALGVADSG